jgi:hypothetical protein
MGRQAMPLGRSTTGVRELIGPVVSRQLNDAYSKPIEVAQHAKISVMVKASFPIHDRGLASLKNRAAFRVMRADPPLSRPLLLDFPVIVQSKEAAARCPDPVAKADGRGQPNGSADRATQSNSSIFQKAIWYTMLHSSGIQNGKLGREHWKCRSPGKCGITTDSSSKKS